jgi:hypothetical protein
VGCEKLTHARHDIRPHRVLMVGAAGTGRGALISSRRRSWARAPQMTGVGSEPSNVRRLKYQNVGYDCESFVAFGYCGDMWVEAFAFLVASQLLTNRRSSADHADYPQMTRNLSSSARALRTFLPSIRRAWSPRSRKAPSPRRNCSSPLASRCKGAEESDGTPGVLAFRVVPDLPDLLGTPAGDGDLASPRQRLLA